MRHNGSLGPTFVSWALILRVHVKPAFALALYGGFLTRLSRPLGALVIFLRAWRPTQTAYLSVSLKEVSDTIPEGRCFIGDSTRAGALASMSPAYTTHPEPYHSDRLQ